jgi:hypothetical protein
MGWLVGESAALRARFAFRWSGKRKEEEEENDTAEGLF